MRVSAVRGRGLWLRRVRHNVEFSGGPLGISTTNDGCGPSAATQG